jgi:hypothetical protein
MGTIQQEHDEITQRIKQSDALLCTNLEYLHFIDKRQNDSQLMSQINRALPMEVRNVDKEYDMWTQTYITRSHTCPSNILSRGGNTSLKQKNGTSVLSIEPHIPLCGGYECLDDTFNRTSVPYNTKKLFDNMTKRV